MYLTLVSLIIVLSLSSCSFFNKNTRTYTLKKEKGTYKLIDNDGEFLVARESGMADKATFAVKRRVTSYNKKESPEVEKSVVLSKLQKTKSGVQILFPVKSQFTVWFEKNKYTTMMEVINDKEVEVDLISPEEQWKGKRTFYFPRGSGVYCFFTQLKECVEVTSFFQRAIKEKVGKMNLHVMWEGFPYFQEQYLNIPDEVFSRAVLNYDGMNKMNQHRFTLEVAGQSIFYLFNKNVELEKVYWITQGYTLSKSNLKDE